MDKLCKIRDIQKAVNLFEESFEKRYALSLNEGMALCHISKMIRLSSGELGELLRLTPSNTSKVISSLEKKGFLRREIGEQDKRQMFFVLTPEGDLFLKSLVIDDIELSGILKKLL